MKLYEHCCEHLLYYPIGIYFHGIKLVRHSDMDIVQYYAGYPMYKTDGDIKAIIQMTEKISKSDIF